ncbi:MAG: YegS/Rv2252/BmrU family lipid kinase [Clostridiales bacterium]|nr:YegS/Rv2252/BmrU family lipid kinase [Clostridiales bacterium]
MKKLLFIYNPCAGRAVIRSRLPEVVDYYTGCGYLVTTYPTQGKRDGYRMIARMEDDYDLIVCSGGDGTLNEIISGVMDSHRPLRLGYVPSGSTNDFGSSIGIPTAIDKAMEVTVNGVACKFDVGNFNDRYFIYVAAFGLFTNVPYSTPQEMKNMFGYAAYIMEGVKALSELKAYRIRLEYDGGKVEGEFIVGLVTNSFSVAGFKNPAGSVTALNDGLFEVILIRMPGNVVELHEILSTLLSEKTDSDLIFYAQTSRIHIESEPLEWTFDGEYGGKYETAEVSIIHEAVTVMAPGTGG